MKSVIKWEAALAEASKDLPEKPEAQVVWHAYKGGKHLGFSKISHKDAEGKFNTYLIERDVLNAEEIAKWEKAAEKAEEKAAHAWKASLRSAYKDLPDAVFCVCFDESLARDRHSGCDEIARLMIFAVDFAVRVIAASQEATQ